MAVKKIGLLGGSFDPVHKAHIALAHSALSELSLDEVQLIPAANPWQRTPLTASPRQRLEMLELATQNEERLVVNPVEVFRGGKTYTIDTLGDLAPEHSYYWIMGSDQLSNFCSWHRWQDIAKKVSLVVAGRPGTATHLPPKLAKLLQKHQRSVIELPFTPSGLSASQIRDRLAHGLPVEDMLDPIVHNYIISQQIYPRKPANEGYSN